MKPQRLSLRSKRDYWLYRAIDVLLRRLFRVLPSCTWTEQLALWWGRRFQPAPCVAKLRSGARIHLDPSDYLQLIIYYLGTFEPHCLRYLKQCAKKGGTVIDVGANIGVFTLESSLLVGEGGRVISIEAAPSLARALQANIQLNGIKHVCLIETAVGNTVGRSVLKLPEGGNQGMFTLGSVAGDEICSVTIDTIDNLVEAREINTIDLIKMDIEGSEYQALRGAYRTLKRCRPVLLIELNEVALSRCGSSTEAVKDLLRELGYRGWQIGRTGKLEAIPPVHACDECIFIHCADASLIRDLGLFE